MNYPLISEYIESILNAEENFNELSNLRPVLDDNGMPIMSSGNFAVVFKMTDGERFYAVKCFIKEEKQRRIYYSQISQYLRTIKSDYITTFRYIDDEIFIDSDRISETCYPVVIMDWIEGLSLDLFIKSYGVGYDNVWHKENKFIHIKELLYNFFVFAKWLIQQPFAHGDLKPDNIIITPDCKIHLIDYDGMFVPSMKDLPALEVGSPLYRNPRKNVFDRSIDDYALITILLFICLSFKKTKWHRCIYREYESSLLLSDNDKLCISRYLDNDTIRELYSLYLLLNFSDISLETITLRDFVTKPLWNDGNKMHAIVFDNYGAIYSEDYSHLFMVPRLSDINRFIVNIKCKHLGPNTFAGYVDPDPEFGMSYYSSCDINEVILSPSLETIGTSAFFGMTGITSLILPNSLLTIEDKAFEHCNKLTSIVLPKNLQNIGLECFPHSLEDISSESPHVIIQDTIGGKAIYFKDCLLKVTKNTISFDFAPNTNSIAPYAFWGCEKIGRKMHLPHTLTKVGDDAFWGTSLSEIIINSNHCVFSDDSLNICPVWGRKYIKGSKKIDIAYVPDRYCEFYSTQKAFKGVKIIGV